MKRRYGSGSVFLEDDGKWTAQWETPPENGKRKRRQLRADSMAAAWKRMRDAQREAPKSSSRSPQSTGSVTVGAFLERWLADVVRTTRRERTWHGYRAIVARLPAEVVGADLADRDLGHRLDAYLLGLDKHPRTVHHYAACLRAAFGYATKKGLMDRNPAADLDLPAIPRANRIPLTAAQLRAFLDFTGGRNGRATDSATSTGPAEGRGSASGHGDSEGDGRGISGDEAAGSGRFLGSVRDPGGGSLADPLHALWVTAAWTGMRQGELLGLRWQDVNLDRASLVVRGSLARLPGPRYVITDPKTDRSRRTVPLVPEVVAVLRDLRKRQLERPGKLDQGLVFCTEAGSPLDASWVSRQFTNAVVAAGLPRVTMHQLRHGCATLWIESGMDLATVADLLGHSTITTTVQTYAHLTEGHRREAVRRFMESIA